MEPSRTRPAVVDAGVRPAAYAGRAYEASARALRGQLGAYFDDPRGSGRPAQPSPTGGRFRGVLSPHIDFGRGGTVYSWAYRELLEKSDAEIFVILGVAHQYARRRFVLTSKDFETPFGRVSTDQAFVESLTEKAGRQFFDDEALHRAEHSVEFQAVFLKYVLGDQRPFTIVPILAGSFHDLMAGGVDPIDSPDVRGFVDAIRQTEAACGKKVAYIGGIDLSHVGPEFGDVRPVDDQILEQLGVYDQSLLERAEAGDPKGWFATAAGVNNATRVCGLSATYTMLHVLGPGRVRGRLLRYGQAVDPARSCCVSFASLAFEDARD